MIWARDSVLNLVQHFVHEVEEEDERGRRSGGKTVIFPRYHQLDTVRRLVQDARRSGAGQRYLVQHSAGSGKSNSIAWLAHQLSTLHDDEDRRVFDSIIVVTDRRVLDRQLQRTIRTFEKTRGVVAAIEDGSMALKEALEAGKNIIVSTLQKFPYIVEEIAELQGTRFAVLIDEAHSSQSGEMRKSLKEVLTTDSLEDAEREDALEMDVEDQLVAEMTARGPQPNVSTFAFTATPKDKTLELFGTKDASGRYAPFSVYSMRQAIEEGFILDVLENYTTYKTYWKLLKKADDDPHYDRAKASRLLRAFVEIHEHAIREKVRVMVEHFDQHVAHRINGRAKAMIVTRSRLHCVRYHRALERYLKERGMQHEALVAFSGTVRDGGTPYTEAGLNGFPESQTRDAFERPENRFLVVANKFQTGFDQPLLHTMYVDKKLGGVNAVQTLSRLNRTLPPHKQETMVLDFANEAEDIRVAFEPYYERTILSEGTDPQLLYDLETRIGEYHLFGEEEMEAFARVYFQGEAGQAELYAILKPVVQRFEDVLDDDEKEGVRSDLNEFVRLYAFLSQILTFQDAELERLYLFSRYLKRVLPVDREDLPREIRDQIDMDSFALRETHSGPLAPDRGKGELEGRGAKPPGHARVEERERLSAIIQELNDRFGANLTEEDRVSLETLERRLSGDPGLQAAARSNARENVRLTFEHKVKDYFQDMARSNFGLYKRVTDDAEFGRRLLDLLFEGFWEGRE